MAGRSVGWTAEKMVAMLVHPPAVYLVDTSVEAMADRWVGRTAAEMAVDWVATWAALTAGTMAVR